MLFPRCINNTLIDNQYVLISIQNISSQVHTLYYKLNNLQSYNTSNYYSSYCIPELIMRYKFYFSFRSNFLILNFHNLTFYNQNLNTIIIARILSLPIIKKLIDLFSILSVIIIHSFSLFFLFSSFFYFSSSHSYELHYKH